MSNAVLFFTFSPVQSFIAEARRSEDLFNGSAILSRLAQAAGRVLESEGQLIYPAELDKHNAPNVLVAYVPLERAEDIARGAEAALLEEWQNIAEKAREKAHLDEDSTWREIWQRQIERASPWQIFWAFAEEKQGYAQAYRDARERVERAKRSRLFSPSEEEGEKDSLSGQRSALRTGTFSARDYWKAMTENSRISPSRVRPGGRELLDSIGLVKRFWEGEDNRYFPSTSTVAAWDFYQVAKQKAPDGLKRYREALDGDLSLYKVNPRDEIFPYDGDLFFAETLTRQRMKDSYNVEVDEATLQKLRDLLKALIEETGKLPYPYYMLIQRALKNSEVEFSRGTIKTKKARLAAS